MDLVSRHVGEAASPLGAGVPLFLFAVIAVCLVAMTVTMMITARQLHATLRRLSAILPEAGQAMREANRLFRLTHRAARHLETLIDDVCAVASKTVGRLTLLRRSAQRFWATRARNGAGADPRLHHRGRQHRGG